MPPWPAWHYLRLYSPGPARGLTGAVQMHAALNFSPARIWKGVVISCLVVFVLGGFFVFWRLFLFLVGWLVGWVFLFSLLT